MRLLQVEDSENDARLIEHLLNASGYAVESRRVENEAQMRAALIEGGWDLIVADYRLPQFSAPEALKVFHESGQDIPFIVVSGAVGEDAAVGIMKAGAHDFLLKDKMDRLIPAVERELKEAAVRQRNRIADEKLRAAHAELEAIYAHAPVLMFVANEQLRVEKINNCAASFCELSTDNCKGKSLCELLGCWHASPTSIRAVPDKTCSACSIWTVFSQAFGSSDSRDFVEVWSPLSCAEKSRGSCLLLSVKPIVFDQTRKALVTAQDVTRLKSVEVSLQASVDSLSAALAEKEVLFQEIHHRVKNNLQIIASLLSIRARKDASSIGAEDLRDCERRVKSMATIHEQLYGQSNMMHVDFGEVVTKIAHELIASFDRTDSIHLKTDVTPTTLTLDQSIPCGLILNELITNVVKYAYPGGEGELAIGLHCNAGRVVLTVADQGVGMESPIGRKGTSLGLQLVEILTRKLKGTVEFKSNPGTTVSLSFPST